jgi:hypothetical protein
MIYNASFHSRRNAQTGVYAAEVVMREVQGASGLQIVQFLRVAKGQPRKALDCLTHGEVLALYEARRDMAQVWPSVAYAYYRLYHWRRRVASGSVVLAVIAVYFYHLREVSLPCEHVFDSLPVKVESISCDLEAVLLCHAVAERSQELVRGFAVAFPYPVGWNQFRVRVQCDENPSIANLRRVFWFYAALVFGDIAPNFVTLNPLAFQILHLRFHEGYTALPGENQQAENCVTVQLCDAFGAANTSAFDEKLNCQQRFIFGHCHFAKQSGVVFGVGLAAYGAPIPPKTVPVFSKTPTFDLAMWAIHVTTLQQALAVCQAQSEVAIPLLHDGAVVKGQTGGAS